MTRRRASQRPASPAPIVNLSRRRFLGGTIVAAGGLALGVHLPPRKAWAQAAAPSAFAPNAFVRLSTAGVLTVVVDKSEMGQGTFTSLPMIVAEEMDADWAKVTPVAAPTAPAYNHSEWSTFQGVGGSTSVSSSWKRLRQAGATARAMLIAAAAGRWGVPAGRLRTEPGVVVDPKTGRRLGYGALAAAAARLPVPENVALKKPADFRLLGKTTQRLDGPAKVAGTAEFGMDVERPGLLTAVVARSPIIGGKPKSFDDTAAMKVKGVRAVKKVSMGIAVIADGYWAAIKGRDALQVDWDPGPAAGWSSAAAAKGYKALAKKPGRPAARRGNAATAMARAHRTLDLDYHFPYLAHAPMEPLNCTVEIKDGAADVWVGTQFQTIDKITAAQVLGLPMSKVRLHTTLLGGGFGRRATPTADTVRLACEVAKDAGAPVKTVWTREDDIQGGYYRPQFYHRAKVGIDEKGEIVAWNHKIVGQSILADTPFAPFMIKDGIDAVSVEGAHNAPYEIPHFNVELHSPKAPVSVLWWRSVGHTHTAYAIETTIDRVAALAGRDPVEYRLAHLRKHPRHAAVLKKAAEMANWGKPRPAGRALGVAVHESFSSYVAEIAEVSFDERRGLKIHKVYCAIDCGFALNPGHIVAQVEGSVIFGLTSMLRGQITIEDGRVQQSNFHDYPMLRINETPEILVHVMESDAPPTGTGEPGVPPIAPAVANAIATLTGRTINRLPLSEAGIRVM